MLLKERRGEVSPEAEVPEEGALWGWGKAGLQHRVTASPVDGGPALHIVTAAPHQVAGAALDPRRGTDPESGPGRLSAHASLVPSCRSKGAGSKPHLVLGMLLMFSDFSSCLHQVRPLLVLARHCHTHTESREPGTDSGCHQKGQMCLKNLLLTAILLPPDESHCFHCTNSAHIAPVFKFLGRKIPLACIPNLFSLNISAACGHFPPCCYTQACRCSHRG